MAGSGEHAMRLFFESQQGGLAYEGGSLGGFELGERIAATALEEGGVLEGLFHPQFELVQFGIEEGFES